MDERQIRALDDVINHVSRVGWLAYPIVHPIVLIKSKIVSKVDWPIRKNSHAGPHFFERSQHHVIFKRGKILKELARGLFMNTNNATIPVMF